MGTPIERAGERVDISIVFEDRTLNDGGEEAPRIGLLWDGWDTTSGTVLDTYENISVVHLEESGETLSLALMILGRETQP